jgi:hypothetical protein
MEVETGGSAEKAEGAASANGNPSKIPDWTSGPRPSRSDGDRAGRRAEPPEYMP